MGVPPASVKINRQASKSTGKRGVHFHDFWLIEQLSEKLQCVLKGETGKKRGDHDVEVQTIDKRNISLSNFLYTSFRVHAESNDAIGSTTSRRQDGPPFFSGEKALFSLAQRRTKLKQEWNLLISVQFHDICRSRHYGVED